MRIKMLTGALVAIAVSSSTFAVAGQPERPGAFGRDRAAAAHTFKNDATSPGGSELGKIASQRGSTNGDLNRAYKQSSGGAPTKGKPVR